MKNKTVLVLGGAGLVGVAVSRLILREGPSKVVIGSLLREEAESAVDSLRAEGVDEGTELAAVWGSSPTVGSGRGLTCSRIPAPERN